MPGSRPRQPDDPVDIDAYKLVGCLGSGGQGVVYLGLAPSAERVAVKMFHSRLGKDPKTRERFRREIAATRQGRGSRWPWSGRRPPPSPPWPPSISPESARLWNVATRPHARDTDRPGDTDASVLRGQPVGAVVVVPHEEIKVHEIAPERHVVDLAAALAPAAEPVVDFLLAVTRSALEGVVGDMAEHSELPVPSPLEGMEGRSVPVVDGGTDRWWMCNRPCRD